METTWHAALRCYSTEMCCQLTFSEGNGTARATPLHAYCHRQVNLALPYLHTELWTSTLSIVTFVCGVKVVPCGSKGQD